jgi:hypothetical protein
MGFLFLFFCLNSGNLYFGKLMRIGILDGVLERSRLPVPSHSDLMPCHRISVRLHPSPTFGDLTHAQDSGSFNFTAIGALLFYANVQKGHRKPSNSDRNIERSFQNWVIDTSLFRALAELIDRFTLNFGLIVMNHLAHLFFTKCSGTE